MGLFNKKAKVPNLPLIDIEKEQQSAISQNLKALPGINDLLSNLNLFNAQQTQNLSNLVLPGLLSQATANAGANLRGELSPDLLANVQDRVAAESLAMGLGGTQFQVGKTGGRYIQTAQQLQQLGQQNFMQLQSLVPNQLGAESMFIPPEKRLEFAYRQNQDQFNRNWLNQQNKERPSQLQAFGQQQLSNLTGAVTGAAGSAIGAAL